MPLQIDSEAVRREQQEALDRVSAAVIAAQEILAGGTAESGKRKAKMQVAIKPAKRARFFDHELSDSGTDSEDDEEIAMFEMAGQLAAAGSSGLDSTISDQETAHMSAQTDSAAAEAAHGLTESGAAMSADLNLNNVSSTFQAGHAGPSSTQSQASLADQSAVASRQLDSTSPASGRSSLLPNDDTGGVPADAKSQSVPAAETNAAIAPHVDVETSVKAGEIDSVKMASRVIQQQEPIDIASFDNAKQLESVGMDMLKAELQRHGMKCGGTVSERAARLFLLKDKTVKDIDRKHLAKQ